MLESYVLLVMLAVGRELCVGGFVAIGSLQKRILFGV